MSHPEFEQYVTIIKNNLEQIHARIAQAAEKSGRDGQEIRLIAVTKLMPLEMIKAGIAAGLRDFGENYPEQADQKIMAISTHKDITWHMIGHIQSRKTSLVCDHFDWVHALDRMKIARYLNRFCTESGRNMPVFIEVNISGEESKHGWQAWDDSDWPALIPHFKEIAQMSAIKVCGLMTMPPFFDDAELTRPYYRRLGRLQNYLREAVPEIAWDQLSIGTSFDYEVAIEEGATMVRIGTSIFGARPG